MSTRARLVLDQRLKKRLQRKLDAMSSEVVGIVGPQAVQDSALALANHMRSVVPVDTGALRDSIGVVSTNFGEGARDYVSWKNAKGRIWYSTKVSVALAIGVVGA